MKKNTLMVAAVLLGSLVQAQEDTASRSLNEVIVTANKFSQKQSTTGKVVTVINQLQIQRSAGKDLAQLLNEQTGITISGANSNLGKDKTVFLRGASSSYTLFLLDGVPLNDPSGTGGTFDIRLIPLEQIERIEILKGSQSTLYGSNAIAGVINIISKKATAEQTTGSGLLSYGSYNTFKGNANINKRGKVFEYNLNYEYYNTEGISEAKDTTGNANFDKDGFNRQSFQANLGFNITDKIKLSPYYRYTEYKGGYDADAFTDASNRYIASLVNTGLIGKLGYSKGTVTVNYGYDFTQRQYQSQYSSSFTGRFHHAEAYVNHNFTDHIQLLAGGNYQSYSIPAVNKTNTIISPYASLLFKVNGLNIEAGSRFNHHNQYGDNFTYSFNPSYLINNKIKLFANASSGFRAPGISELFGPYGANPNLTPEKSRNLEGGAQTWLVNNKLSLLATYYNRTIKNVIIYGNRGYENRDEQKDHGVEAEVNYEVNKQFNIKMSYAFVDGAITQKVTGKDTSFNNLLRRPKHTFNLYAGYQITKNLFVSTSVQSFSKRMDIYYNPVTFIPSQVTLKAYALWNAYAEYSLFHNNLKVFVDAKNLTNNTGYYEVYGYSVQGFTANAGIRFTL